MSAPVEDATHVVAIDERWDDEDSSYEGDSSAEQSATTSVGSSVFSFTYSNGRRYHSDRFKQEYFMPNDESEQDRLDLYHHIFLSLLDGKLYISPLENPQRILDIGTGTGIWAIDMADENPQATIIGTDISPIQPNWVPPNLTFEVDDMEEEWTYKAADAFDFIHIRSLSGSFKDWENVLAQTYKNLKPGGYVEFQDYGCEVFDANGKYLVGPDTGKPLATYFHHITGAAAKIGRDLIIARGFKARLEKAGFVDIIEEKKVWPIGDWPKDPKLKEVGKFARMGAIDSVYAFSVSLLTRVEGWSVPEVEALCDLVRKDLSRGGNKYFCEGWFISGRRPLEKETK